LFVSYKRNTQTDEPLVREVVKALESRGSDAFMDVELRAGDDWARELETHIRTSDFLIVFLSEQSVRSEMVRGEIEIARDQASKSSGKPKIIPVRVAFNGTLPYPLNSYLDGIQ
jgi:TIR domain